MFKKPLLWLLPAFLVSLVFSAQAVFAEDSLTLSLSSDSAAMTLMPDVFGSASQTITASTTSEYGYTITMKTAGTTTGLVNAGDDTLVVPTISLSSGATTVPVASFGYGYGYSVDGGANFKPAPEVTSEEGDTLFKTRMAGENTHTLTWGALVPGDTAAGTYQNSFTIAVVVNPETEIIAEYSYEGQMTFDGTNYLDTGIALFSEENHDKDFVVTFTIDEIDSSQVNLATIFSDMDESGPPYPGVLLRYGSSRIRTIANSNSQGTEKTLSSTTGDYVIKRETNIISYSTDGGQTFNYLNDYTGFSYPHNVTATFGGTKDGNGNPFRLFKGKLFNMSIVLSEPTNYTVRYNANGGTGSVNSQALPYGSAATLTTDTFTRSYYIFDHWNTAADDSGTSYQPGETVLNLTEAGSIINLYAIWREAPRYSIVYHSNTDSAETAAQEFIYSIEQALDANTFVNGELKFVGWNTAADNSGTFYEDGQSILNLTDEDGTVINLYAIWSDENYLAEGATVFDGTNYIDTGIQLFSDTNVGRDFVISFEITERSANSSQATMMSAMDESGSPWPGMVYRVASSTNMNELVVNSSSTTKAAPTDRGASTAKVRIRRVGTKIYEKINDDDEQLVLDMSDLVHTFDSPVAFGASLKANGTPQRYFKGTLSNIKLMLIEATPAASSEVEASTSTSETESAENASSESEAPATSSSVNDNSVALSSSTEATSTDETSDATTDETSDTTDETAVADSYSDPLGVAETTKSSITTSSSQPAALALAALFATTTAAAIAVLIKRDNNEN